MTVYCAKSAEGELLNLEVPTKYCIEMALPHRPSGISSVTQEGDYGIEHGMKQRAPASGFSHPVEESERTYRQRQEDLRLTSARRTFGTGFVLHRRHEKAAV
ncbi:unnamed protein product, partial [Meganyctiphanes norvegica]